MCTVDTRLARLRAALHPGVAGRLDAFRDAVDALAEAPAAPRTIAVVGLVPGAGRTTVTALLALAVAGHSHRRVVVIDAVTSVTGPRNAPGRPPAGDDVSARSVTALLGGDVRQGRLPELLAGAPIGGIPRRRIRQALTPDAAVPVLSLPPGRGGVPPQRLEQTLDRLAYRADVILIDTPAGPAAPVLHAVLERADHYLLVAPAGPDLARQARAGRVWLSDGPGRPRTRTATLVAVSRGLRVPHWSALPEPVTVLARDEALRRRQLGQLSRSSMITALALAADALTSPMSTPLPAA